MKLIESYEADATMLDAGDVYTAGNKYNLIPILSEVYNLGEPEYYVVAVAKARDAATELIYLKGKPRLCLKSGTRRIFTRREGSVTLKRQIRCSLGHIVRKHLEIYWWPVFTPPPPENPPKKILPHPRK